MKEKVNHKIIFDIGFLLLLFIAVDIVLTTIFQIVDIPMTMANVIISSILTVIIYLIFNKKRIKKENIKNYAISISMAILICVIGTYCMGKVFDTSCDGNFYHKTAIGLIKEGWNPLYEDSEKFCEEHDSEIENKNQCLWIDHYPKVTWNFAASIYAVTNNIESGKVITVLLGISILCITYSYLSDRFLKKWQAILLAILIPCNPIVSAQIFTYYVDGVMGLLIYGIIMFLIMITDKEFSMISDKEKWIGLAAEIILCMNIKFTGIYFAAIFSIVFYIFWLIASMKKGTFKEDVLKYTLKFVAIVVVGIGIVGGSTYIRNVIDHQNPLYPLIGKDKVDIITEMQPKSFGEKNRFVKLFESLFAYSKNITYSSGESPTLKIPFTMNKEEMENLGIPDTRIGGYGIYFSGIIIVSIMAIIYAAVILLKNNRNIFKYFMAILIGISITTLCLDEAWWARYSPQIYLIPVLTIFSLFYISNIVENKRKKIVINVITVFVIILMFINVSSFIHWRVQDIKEAKNIENSIVNLKNYIEEKNEKEITFNDNNYYGILFNMRDYKVEYQLTKNKETKEHYAYNYQILY